MSIHTNVSMDLDFADLISTEKANAVPTSEIKPPRVKKPATPKVKKEPTSKEASANGRNKESQKAKRNVKVAKTAKGSQGSKAAKSKPANKTSAADKRGVAVKAKTEETASHFAKPGQRYITPPKGDATRGYYESLYQENTRSIIAIKYCVEHGLFGGVTHSRLLEIYHMLQAGGHFKRFTGGISPAAVKAIEKTNAKAIKIQEKKSKLAAQ
ncbi:hypothetical protein BdWA1_001312 [Babesia duncani]|uniref:Uncharacterized protein n=1 Tax=Babesia duncani TaxID=323732 RepID=A0AAD9PNW9_9APIC|nr:hypothetical protein BdWA1_001312 [Babesia duncani]